MKLIAVETFTDDFISGFIELKDEYARFSFESGSAAMIHARWPKKDFRSLEHFANQMGKFLPTFVFLRKARVAKLTDFEFMRELIENDPVFRACLRP